MCATTLMQGASKQLILGSGHFPYSYLSTFGPTQGTTYWPQITNAAAFAKIGIPPLSTPGAPAHVAPLFNTPGHSVAGDVVYVPSSDTVVASMNVTATGNNIMLHYALGAPSSPGAVLGLDPNPALANSPFTMFSFEDDVYVNTQSGTYHYDASTPLTPGTFSLSAMSISPYDGYMDGASSPNCIVALSCTEDDMYTASGAQGQPGGVYDIYYNMGIVLQYFNFTQNMWNHYTGVSLGPTGCDWWIHKWNTWSGQLPNLTNPNQILLKTAKIAFAWDMIIACDCDTQNITPNSPDNIDSYKCVGNGRCVLVGETEIGQFTSLSACQDNCGDSGWNCKTITNIGQPGSYQTCVQASLPNVGTYTTLSDCQNGFINGGVGPCRAMESWDDSDEAPPERFKRPLRRPHKNKKN
jgi:hypothetical protein